MKLPDDDCLVIDFSPILIAATTLALGTAVSCFFGAPWWIGATLTLVWCVFWIAEAYYLTQLARENARLLAIIADVGRRRLLTWQRDYRTDAS